MMATKVKEKKPVEVIVFQNPQKRKKQEHVEISGSTNASTSGATSRPVYDQRKARYDIRKLGIHGMSKKDKESAMADFLVELGAKPAKNPCYHIEEYKKIKKQKEQEEKDLEELERKAGLKKKRAKAKPKRARDDLLNYVDGQVGYYKNGVQFVNKSKR